MIDLRTAPYAALLLRVALGVLLVAHGFLLKVLVFGVAGTIGFFQSIGYPGWLALLVIAAETLGGLLLIAGIASRWVALALVPVLAGATLHHLPSGWLFTAQGGGWEYPAFWTVALLVQSLLGDGAHALGARFLGRDARTAPALGAA